jgi:MYXO-CTERM domain-containing protein
MRAGFIAGACCMGVLFAAAHASAYCLNKNADSTPQFMSWTPLPGTYRLSDTLTDPALVTAIGAAFTTWASVPCTTLQAQPFQKGDSFPIAGVEFQHSEPYLYIFWHTSPWDGFKNSSNPSQPYVTNTFVYWNKTGGIVGASVAINAADYKWSTTGDKQSLDVQNELTHLIGTVIGLAETPEAGHAMSSGLKFGDTSKQTLSQDDQNALIYLYKGASCAEPPAPDPNTGCSTGTNPSTDSGTTAKDGGSNPSGDGGGNPTQQDSGGVLPNEAGISNNDGGSTGSKCTSNAQCGKDEVCTVDGVCAKTAGDSGGGCGCEVGQRARSNSTILLGLGGLLMLAGLFRLRQRR